MLALVHPVAHHFAPQFPNVVNQRRCTPLTSSTYRQKVVVSPGSITYVVLQEQLTPRNGLKKAPREQQPFQQNPQHTPQQTPQQNPQQQKLEGTSFTARTTLTLNTALSLYNMTDCQSFWETEQDTRCLIGWGSSTVVVAFRGTASMKNALADLQVCCTYLAESGLLHLSMLRQLQTVYSLGATCLNKHGLTSTRRTLYWSAATGQVRLSLSINSEQHTFAVLVSC